MGDENFGAELRRLRNKAGLSLTELAHRIHYTKGYLSKVENGIAPPNEALAAICDTELRTGGTLTAVVPRRRRKIKARTFTVRPAGLPSTTPFFVGRESEIATIDAILRGTQPGSPAVCAVDGLAGTGKTALAVHVAHAVQDEFPDGVLFLDLHTYTPGATEVGSAEALDRLLRQLGVPGDEIPRSAEDRAVLYRGCLLDRRVLVVIDNARTAAQVLPLLPGDPGCRMLITSRNRLPGLDDAHHVSLGPLSDTEAVELFASVAGPGRMPADAEGRRLVAKVVDQCGRLPLAVRIAAARYQSTLSWTPADLVERLADRQSLFEELDDGTRSVYGAFRLSYEELAPALRELLVFLVLYPGTEVDPYVAGALVDLPMVRARRMLEHLQMAHLVTARPDGRSGSHDLVRLFAEEAGADDVPDERRRAALSRLLDYAVLAMEQADLRIAPGRFRPDTAIEHRPAVREFPDAAAATAWLEVEWSALTALVRVASDNGLHQRAWQLAFLLRDWFFLTKQWQPWVATHEVALASARAVGDRWAEATTLNNLGIAHVDQGDLDAADGYYQQALPLFRELSDEHGQVTTMANLGWTHYYRGRHEAALRELSAAAEFYRRTGAERNAAITSRGIALAETAVGRYADSLAHGTDALNTCLRLGLFIDAAMALNCLAWTHFRAGHHDMAAVTYRQALEMADRANSSYEAARAMTGLGNVAAAADDLVEAQRCWDEAEQRYPNLNTVTVGESRARHAETP
ncbi:MAG TPA: tetratricopeptide repeat protein [Pseudonocardiaceae bacterium]|jgi:tetratricopeptide (TPR) repeat protein/transcriptional regulator with XRE-family HTH domain